jgi:hypothetical protein
MRVRTITVAGLLLTTALLAFDMAAVELVRREKSWRPGNARLLVEVLPAVNALALGLHRLRRQLALRGEASPFLVGFQVAGWPAVAAALIAWLGFSDQMFYYERWARAHLAAIWHEYVMWDGGFTHDHWDGITVGFDVFAMAAPQLLLAALGGCAAAFLGVVVVKGPAPAGRPRSIPARRATAALAVMVLVLVTTVWAAGIRRQWVVYRHLADGAASGEVHHRQEYERTLARLRSLDENPGEMAGNPAVRTAYRRYLVDHVEESRRWMAWDAAVRKLYEPAARRPWLPIPPNPPLNPFEVIKFPTGPTDADSAR